MDDSPSPARAGTGPRARLAAVVLAVVAPAAARAQEPFPLDTLRVQVASRAAAQVAPSRSVEVLDREDIRLTGATSVPELLAWAMGVDIMPRSSAQADVAIRGGTFEQVVVLVDGIRVSDLQTGHFDLDLAVPVAAIERVEVLRGAASSLYGPDAMGGVINVVTRRADAAPAVRARAGSFGTALLSAGAGGSAGPVAFGGAAEAHRTDGHRPGTDLDALQGRASLTAPVGALELGLAAAGARRDFGANAFYAPYDSYERTRTATASASLDGPVGGLELHADLSARRHTDDFILRRDDPAFYRNEHETTTLQSTLALARRRAGSWLVLGAEGALERLRSASLGDRDESRAGLFAEAGLGRAGRATADLGLRADWHSGYDAALTPSLGGAWWPHPRVRLRAAAATSFRAPSWTERFYTDPAHRPAPGLQPERARSVEAAVAWSASAGLTAEATFFARDAEDLIDYVRPSTDPAAPMPWLARNVEEAEFRGVEAQLRHADLLGARWTAHAAFLSVDAPEADGYLSKYALRPLVESAGVRFARPVGERLSLGFGVIRGRRAGEDAWVRADGRVGVRAGDWEAYALIENAFDDEHLDIVGARGAGRAVYVGVVTR